MDGYLTEEEVRRTARKGLERLPVDGRSLLVIIPDGTRTMPMPLMFDILERELGPRVASLDYLVALGTHSPMDDAHLSRLVGRPVINGRAGGRRIFNHRWDDPATFVELGTLPAQAVEDATCGLLSRSVPVALNRLAVEHDHVLICGPVFPHEVAGFSGGTKYLFPGIAAPEIIHFTHWLGALITSSVVIGTIDTPVRAIIDKAAALLETPLSLLALVVTHDGTAGVFCGDPHAAWRGAASLSSQRHVVWVDEPYDRVLAVMPSMYDDLWTAAKGAYKTEPVVVRWRRDHHLRAPRHGGQLRPRQADRGDRIPLPRLFSVAVGSLRGISRRDPRAFDARQGAGHLRGRRRGEAANPGHARDRHLARAVRADQPGLPGPGQHRSGHVAHVRGRAVAGRVAGR